MNGLPDILADDLDVVFCGLNPGLRAADAGHHLVGRGNRFWPVLFRSGFTPRLFEPADDRLLLNEDCGLTTVVAPPPRASTRFQSVNSPAHRKPSSANSRCINQGLWPSWARRLAEPSDRRVGPAHRLVRTYTRLGPSQSEWAQPRVIARRTCARLSRIQTCCPR